MGTNVPQLHQEICRTILSLPYHQQASPLPLPPSALNKGHRGVAPLPQYIGVGTVLNIWSNSTEGQMIHLVVTGGEVKPGTWFSSGGWAGDSVLSNFYLICCTGNVVVINSDEALPLQDRPATRGMGIKIRISTKVNEEPRPIGDRIYFFTELVHTSYSSALC